MKEFDCSRKSRNIPRNPTMNPYYWEMERNFDFYINDVKPLVAEIGTQKMDGMHGLDTHTNAVVFRGIDYALSLRQNPTPVIFACAFHDMARTHDGMDMEHGKNAIPMAMKIMKQFPDLLDKETRMQILSAVMNHTTGTIAPDYISACLWDADRTRMAWKYGFDAKFFNTQRGAHVASHYYLTYLEFQRKCLSGYRWEKQY